MSTNTHRPPDLAVPVSTIDHQIGAEHAPVTVVEYGDFECAVCKQAAPVAKLLIDTFPEKLRFVFRHFPIESAHPHALLAAEAAECAGAQGKFWEYHAMLFEHQTHLDTKHLHGYAETLGLDLARYTAELDDHVYLQRVREHMEGGRRSHLRATPGFFVAGRIVDVSYDMHALFPAVEAALREHRR